MAQSTTASRLVAAALVVACVWFWAEYVALRRSAADRFALSRVAVRPIPLNGFLFPTAYLDVRPAAVAEAILVLVTSDECRASQKQVGPWLQLLDSIRDLPPDAVEVVVLSKAGSRIPQTVRENSPFPTRTRVIDDAVTFSRRTGISWTPALIVLDSHARLRLITEALTPIIRDEAIRQLRSSVNKGRSRE
jgi:hypothetical protein